MNTYTALLDIMDAHLACAVQLYVLGVWLFVMVKLHHGAHTLLNIFCGIFIGQQH